jgi:hypothetical protein
MSFPLSAEIEAHCCASIPVTLNNNSVIESCFLDTQAKSARSGKKFNRVHDLLTNLLLLNL